MNDDSRQFLAALYRSHPHSPKAKGGPVTQTLTAPQPARAPLGRPLKQLTDASPYDRFEFACVRLGQYVGDGPAYFVAEGTLKHGAFSAVWSKDYGTLAEARAAFVAACQPYLGGGA